MSRVLLLTLLAIAFLYRIRFGRVEVWPEPITWAGGGY